MFPVRLVTSLLVVAGALTCIDQVFCQTPPLNVSGKWVGALDIAHADGSVEPDQAYLSLAVNNGTVSGTAGNSPDHQTPITNGRVTNNKLNFEMLVARAKL